SLRDVGEFGILNRAVEGLDGVGYGAVELLRGAGDPEVRPEAEPASEEIVLADGLGMMAVRKRKIDTQVDEQSKDAIRSAGLPLLHSHHRVPGHPQRASDGNVGFGIVVGIDWILTAKRQHFL